jgi:hypothetical protein
MLCPPVGRANSPPVDSILRFRTSSPATSPPTCFCPTGGFQDQADDENMVHRTQYVGDATVGQTKGRIIMTP